MTLEIEAKIKVDRLEPIAERLSAIGASYAGERVQRDVYFRDAERRLAASGCGLRLRIEIVGGQTAALLTFKGARQDSAYKKRPEFETAVADAEAMVRILEGLGCRRRLIVAKTRRVWTLDGCEICLDDVPPLGLFVEVEGENETLIQNVLTRLDLADRPHVASGYAAMLAAVKQHESDCL